MKPIEQIQLHEDNVLNMYKMRITNVAPSSIDSLMVERMISISFRRDYTRIFSKKEFPKGFFLFDVGKVTSIESCISDKCARINVDFKENGGVCTVDICLDNYATDEVKYPTFGSQWRLLEL